MEKVSRILLVDDHRLLMEGERSLLAPYSHLRIGGQAVSGEEAISSAASLRPDICLLDLSMPGIGGVEHPRNNSRMPRDHLFPSR